jgi:hypothetical protein
MPAVVILERLHHLSPAFFVAALTALV